jgi:hypothetical protein
MAISAKDDAGRYFFDRKIEDFFPIRISLEPGNGKDRKQYTRRAKSKVNRSGNSTATRQAAFDLDYFVAFLHWVKDVEQAPTNRHGWVLQKVIVFVSNCVSSLR